MNHKIVTVLAFYCFLDAVNLESLLNKVLQQPA